MNVIGCVVAMVNTCAVLLMRWEPEAVGPVTAQTVEQPSWETVPILAL